MHCHLFLALAYSVWAVYVLGFIKLFDLYKYLNSLLIYLPPKPREQITFEDYARTFSPIYDCYRSD